MLDKMILHFEASQNKSLLARIYGVFSLKTNIFSSVDILIMQNITYAGVFQRSVPKMTFDLKGSLYGRMTKLSVP